MFSIKFLYFSTYSWFSKNIITIETCVAMFKLSIIDMLSILLIVLYIDDIKGNIEMITIFIFFIQCYY